MKTFTVGRLGYARGAVHAYGPLDPTTRFSYRFRMSEQCGRVREEDGARSGTSEAHRTALAEGFSCALAPAASCLRVLRAMPSYLQRIEAMQRGEAPLPPIAVAAC